MSLEEKNLISKIGFETKSFHFSWFFGYTSDLQSVNKDVCTCMVILGHSRTLYQPKIYSKVIDGFLLLQWCWRLPTVNFGGWWHQKAVDDNKNPVGTFNINRIQLNEFFFMFNHLNWTPFKFRPQLDYIIDPNWIIQSYSESSSASSADFKKSILTIWTVDELTDISRFWFENVL